MNSLPQQHKLIKLQVKKIWYGDSSYGKAKITLRSYWVNEAIRKGHSIDVIYNDRHMILTPRKLKSPVGERIFKSKIGAEDYSLLDYFWQPVDL